MVEKLTRICVVDWFYKVIALVVFERHFTRVTENEAVASITSRTINDGKRATQEIATVVISDVLVVQE
jgi:hypothetical protein